MGLLVPVEHRHALFERHALPGAIARRREEIPPAHTRQSDEGDAALGEPGANAVLALGRRDKVHGIFAAGFRAHDDHTFAIANQRPVRRQGYQDLRECVSIGDEIDEFNILLVSRRLRIIIACHDGGDRLLGHCSLVERQIPRESRHCDEYSHSCKNCPWLHRFLRFIQSRAADFARAKIRARKRRILRDLPDSKRAPYRAEPCEWPWG